MNKIEKIHELAQEIINKNKLEFSVTEMAVIIQSQYYNIEDLFTFSANYTEDNIDNRILIAEEIVNLSNSYFMNLKSIPDIIGWEDNDIQKERILGIKKESEKSLQLLIAMRNHKNINSLGTMMELKRIINLNNQDL